MTFKPTATDHISMDKFLTMVLDAHKASRISGDQAVGELAHILTAAAIGNEAEFRAHINMTEDQLFED